MLKKKYRILISLLLVLIEEFYDQIELGVVPETVKFKDELKECVTFLKEHFEFLQVAGVETIDYLEIRSQIQKIWIANK